VNNKRWREVSAYRWRLPFLGVLTTVLVANSVSSDIYAEEAWHPAAGPLMTPWSTQVSPTNALPEYPRPQMVREHWQNLNGLWDYAVSNKSAEQKPAAWDAKILVPFCIESALSGVMKPLGPDQRLWYRREFTIPEGWNGQPNQKAAVLAQVGSALLREDQAMPRLKAVLEAAVGAIYESIRIMVEIEIDEPAEHQEPPSWRELVLAACQEHGIEDLLDAESEDIDEWVILGLKQANGEGVRLFKA